VLKGQLARAKVAAIPIFLAATLQSVGLVVLLKGLVDTRSDVTQQSVVAGSSVTVVSFVALNLLAQRFGVLKASGALDYFGALPVRPSAIVTATATAWASFTIPGSVLVAVGGLGALIGLLAPRPEIATVTGQLGMSLVMFLGLVPAHRLPGVVQAVRAVVPSTYAVDAFAESFKTTPSWTTISADLAICVAVCVLALTASAWAFRRAVRSR
jgi:ABC-2 type transport system permease protein